MIEEKKMIKPKIQNLILENRAKLSVTGIIDVDSFNEECVVVETDLGLLIVRGDNLRINKLNIDSSELNIEGNIFSCEYNDRESSNSGKGFFSRVFR